MVGILRAFVLKITAPAGVVELVDAPDSKSGARDGVRVRVPPPAPWKATTMRLLNSISKRLSFTSHRRDAIRQVEYIKSLLINPESIALAPLLFRGKGYFETLDLKQNIWEFTALVKLLSERKLNNVCEIGSLKGGSLFTLCQLASPDARIVSIDLPGGNFGGGHTGRFAELFYAFTREQQSLTLIRGDSHSPETLAEFRSSFEANSLDFLFIDGDHTYEGVKQDYLMYGPFVKRSGLIAFHDILPRPDLPLIGVWKLWAEIKSERPASCREFIAPDGLGRKIGIGVLAID
jgi:hypothetical protein